MKLLLRLTAVLVLGIAPLALAAKQAESILLRNVQLIDPATHAFDQGFDVREDDEFSFFDVRLDIPVWEKASFSIGKQKEPISMERIMSMVHLPMQERSSVSDALMPSRNVGIVWNGSDPERHTS